MLTIREANRMTGVKIRTIRSWVQRGEIMFTRFPGSKKIAIPESEIEKMRRKKTPNFCINSMGSKKQGENIKAVISQREGNGSKIAFNIFCHENKGLLITTIKDAQGDIVAEFATEG